MFVLLTAGSSSAQLPVSIFGTSTPGVADGGDAQSVVLGVKIFADVPGQVLGCSFYKSATNTGNHVVSLWDSTGRLLASQSATSETASGKQLVVFSSPVAIAANQVFTCGYFAPAGHFSNDKNSFTVQANVPPLHVPVNGGVFVYGIQPTHWPTSTWTASNYWVDVLFVPANQTQNWISGIKVSPAAMLPISPGVRQCQPIHKWSMDRLPSTAASLHWAQPEFSPTWSLSGACLQQPPTIFGCDAAIRPECW